MAAWPKCAQCGELLAVNEYYSIGYCQTLGCADVCLVHRQPVSSVDGAAAECALCRNERLVKEARNVA